MKLSIIICVYNTDRKYFEECIASICESTLNRADYEILVIDDGSDTDYSDLVSKYSLRYIKTENRGIFRARLLGISEAVGDYISFVDSDDTVSFNYHAPMLKKAIEQDFDIVFNDWAFHTERSKYYCAADKTIATDFMLSSGEVLSFFTSQRGREHSFFVLWNKLFAAHLLKDSLKALSDVANGEEKFNYSEDALMCFYAFRSARKISNLHTGYYFYRIHSSQTVNVISSEKLASQISCMAKTFEIMKNNIPNGENSAQLLADIREWQLLMARTHYSHAKANNYLHLYDLIKEKYETEELHISRYRDGSVYASGKLLPKNLSIIDKALLALWLAEGKVFISPKRCDEYTCRSLEYIAEVRGNVEIVKNGDELPRPVIPIKDRIILNPFIYRIGLVLFKKGSKLRAFLKKHI